ncbi:hypothetical protein K458DRAFT_247697, partial [Lentithecium fluviatile CBS 122367]
PPTATARPTPKKTVSLKLTIPKHEPDVKEKRQLASRKGAAKKWIPKLQNAFPDDKEIKKAYNLKLMRHYPANPTPAQPIPDQRSPVIQESPRVTKLLKSFPALDIPATPPKTPLEVNREKRNLLRLAGNQMNTQSREAIKLAWESFAKPDYPKREVMVESALPVEDLEKEHLGRPNRLPEWKKHKTSKF